MEESHLQKEYQTVILAALLHDIGKFWQRIWWQKEKQGSKLAGGLWSAGAV